MRQLALALLSLFGVVPVTSAETIFREVQLTTAADQISRVAGQGRSWVVWKGDFGLDPFTFHDEDTLDVTVHFDRPIMVVGGSGLADSVSAVIDGDGPLFGVDTSHVATLDFLDVQGALTVQHLSERQSSIGTGIAMLFRQLDLTDSSFSFGGLHYSISEILPPGGQPDTGLPKVFDRGEIRVSTFGDGGIYFVPEPPTVALLAASAIASLAYAWRRKQTRGQLSLSRS